MLCRAMTGGASTVVRSLRLSARIVWAVDTLHGQLCRNQCQCGTLKKNATVMRLQTHDRTRHSMADITCTISMLDRAPGARTLSNTARRGSTALSILCGE